MRIDYKHELNPSQYEAVKYTEGALLVIAGAGSGKTRVLTYKIAYLLESGMKPWNILALTFTNKAAQEMRGRIASLVGKEEASYLWMGTFHSVFSRILRIESELLGYTSNFTIYDQSDSRNLLKTLIREMGLDEKKYKPNMVQNQISLAKNRLVFPEKYIRDVQTVALDKKAGMSQLGEIYRRYCERCKLANAMDFDDLLLNTYLLFIENPDVCARYAERFHYVLVDEYQDTNYAQHQIVWLLTKTRKKVCAVGDDAQSIYSFRGANIDNILSFVGKYENPAVVQLPIDVNFRSREYIVSAANSLIAHNTKQFAKNKIDCPRGKGEPLHVERTYSDLEEAYFVVKKIEELHSKQNIAYTDVAILYRTNGQSRSFEEALHKLKIPYRIFGGLSFYQRKEVKDALAYFRLIMNPEDEESFKRIINYPARGIGQTTLVKIGRAASDNGVSFWSVASDPEKYDLGLNKGTIAKLHGFCQLISGFEKDSSVMDASAFAQKVLQDSGMIHDIFQSSNPEDISRQDNIQELLNDLALFVDDRMEEGRCDAVFLNDYLQEISLLSDLEKDKSDEESGVNLMTIHSAKGLEFSVVFVVGLEEGLLPSLISGDSLEVIEEERRLCYVAITRAADVCYLSFALTRYRFGQFETCTPSRFLREIDNEFIDTNDFSFSGMFQTAPIRPRSSWQRRPTGMADMESSSAPVRRVASVSGLRRVGVPSPRPVSTGMSPSASASAHPSSTQAAGGLQVGQTIEHERFGLGRVTSLEGAGENTKATVEFQHSGTKQLLLRFARFKVVE